MSDIKKKKAELQKQLSDLSEIEQKENKNKIAVLLKTLKADIENYESLCSFKKHGKIKVELSYNIEYSFDPHDLGAPNPNKVTDPDSADLGEFEGNCYVIVKEPKNYNVAMFIAEDAFGNMNIDNYNDITSIHPDVKKHCDKFLKAKRNLSQKIVKTAEKLDLDIDDAFDAVYRTFK
jgi:hypothetical protein